MDLRKRIAVEVAFGSAGWWCLGFGAGSGSNAFLFVALAFFGVLSFVAYALGDP